MDICVLKHLELLGFRARDKITGAEGVVDTVSFDLYGCVQASINMGLKDDGERKPAYWFDVSRLERVNEDRVMEPPNYIRGEIAEGKQGPADKPTARA